MIRQYVVTLETGVPKQVSSVLAGAADVQLAAVWLQPRATNTAPVFVGTNTGMSSTAYGVRIPAPAAGDPPAPFSLGDFARGGSGYGAKSPILLSELWVLGTTGDFLHVLALSN